LSKLAGIHHISGNSIESRVVSKLAGKHHI